MTAALVGTAPTAVGGDATITASGTSFTPPKSRVAQGTSVVWRFFGTHTTTSNQGFWNSRQRSSGTFSREMPSSGKFPYHCAVHAGMNGSIVVPLKASGSAGTGWTLRWSAAAAANGRAFDVEYRRMGTTTWRSFRTNTTAASGFFDRTQAGDYQLRARTSNTAAGKESGWSPVKTLQIS